MHSIGGTTRQHAAPEEDLLNDTVKRDWMSLLFDAMVAPDADPDVKRMALEAGDKANINKIYSAGATKPQPQWDAFVAEYRIQQILWVRDNPGSSGGVLVKPVRTRVVPLLPAWKLANSMQWVLCWKNLEVTGLTELTATRVRATLQNTHSTDYLRRQSAGLFRSRAAISGPRFAPPPGFCCLPVICLGPQIFPFGIPNSAPRAALAACSDSD
jgi:hypothetical protein